MEIQICISELYYRLLQSILIIYVIYNLTWRRVKSSHMTASEHNETNAHWRFFFHLFCKMQTNVTYISLRVNIVKILILFVSRQRHFSWNIVSLRATTRQCDTRRSPLTCHRFLACANGIHWHVTGFSDTCHWKPEVSQSIVACANGVCA